MKCQNLFSCENKKKHFNMLSAKMLPRVISINAPSLALTKSKNGPEHIIFNKIALLKRQISLASALSADAKLI